MNAVATATRLVERLLACGVNDAVLSPGSRSGPLALALHAADVQGLLRLHVRVDEREAAFLALGLAKSGRLVPVVTTSGTAVANLHPAMLEALHTGVPVLAVTADRPARLRGTGANQTTEQRGFFAGVRFLTAVDEIAPAHGPTHLNLELDEPLIEAVDWEFALAEPVPPPEQVAEPAVVMDCLADTVVLAGDRSGKAPRELAEAIGWPLLAEPTSGSRGGSHAVTTYRALLGRPELAGRIARVVSFGHATLSRPVTALLARADIDIVHVGDQSTFPVPAGANVTFVDAVRADGSADPAWLDLWRSADASAVAAIDAELDGTAAYDVARTVDTAVTGGGLLVIGSSNPIRDLDLVGSAPDVERTVMGNRGLAGIDGLLSTAIGAALAGSFTRSIAYVGDLTFLHGSNGLLIGPHEPRPDLTIVVVNDDGGSIFATLEQGAEDYADAFERVYATPTGADLAALCTGYRIAHRRIAPGDLAAALEVPPKGIEVIEVPVDRQGRRSLEARLMEAARI